MPATCRVPLLYLARRSRSPLSTRTKPNSLAPEKLTIEDGTQLCSRRRWETRREIPLNALLERLLKRASANRCVQTAARAGPLGAGSAAICRQDAFRHASPPRVSSLLKSALGPHEQGVPCINAAFPARPPKRSNRTATLMTVIARRRHGAQDPDTPCPMRGLPGVCWKQHRRQAPQPPANDANVHVPTTHADARRWSAVPLT